MTQPDHVTRLIPLLTSVQAKPVPAFGSVLYDLYRQHDTPAGEPLMTRRASALINPVGNGALSALPTTALSSVWDALQHQDKERLEHQFRDKVVVILPHQSVQDSWLLPTGQSVPGIVARTCGRWLTGPPARSEPAHHSIETPAGRVLRSGHEYVSG